MRLCRYFHHLSTKQSKIPVVNVSKLTDELAALGELTRHVPALVLGAEDDKTVDDQGLKETADFYGVQPTVIPRMAHDMMLVWHSLNPKPHWYGYLMVFQPFCFGRGHSSYV